MIAAFTFTVSPGDPSVAPHLLPSVASCALQTLLGHEWTSRRHHLSRSLFCPVALSLLSPEDTHPQDRLRITLLGNHWIETFLRRLQGLDRSGLLITPRAFAVSWTLTPTGLPRLFSFSDLLSHEFSTSSITFRLITPVVLSPFPDPEHIFGWLLRKWNHHSPKSTRLPPLPENDLRNILVSRHHISRTPIRARSRPSFGTTGKITYDLKHISPESRLHLVALARFASIFGVGWGTHLGWGQLSLLEVNRIA